MKVSRTLGEERTLTLHDTPEDSNVKGVFRDKKRGVYYVLLNADSQVGMICTCYSGLENEVMKQEVYIECPFGQKIRAEHNHDCSERHKNLLKRLQPDIEFEDVFSVTRHHK